MDDNVNGESQQQPNRVQSSRLGQRVARYVFVALLAISAIEIVPAYNSREQELLKEIEQQGAKAVSVLLSANPADVTESLARHSDQILSRTPITGLVIYLQDGEALLAAGETVKRQSDQVQAADKPSFISRILGSTNFERSDNGTRFETFWMPKDLGAPYVVAARLDSSSINAQLRKYATTLIWVAFALAAVTTIVMLIVLNRVILKPVIAIQQSIRGASEDLGAAQKWVIEDTPYGEIGELTVSVNQILKNVSENFRTVQKQNEKILQEASRRQEAEEEARLKHRQLAEAIEAFPGGFAVFDAEDRLMLSNDTWKEFYPDSGDLVVPGVKFEDILRAGITADRKSGHYAYGAYWFKDRLEQHRNGTTNMERRLSTGRWMRSTERLTEDGGVLGIWTDISDRKVAEIEHEELQSQFFQAQKHEALGTLAGGIADDFNSLLEIILGNARILEADFEPDAPGRKELEAIENAGNQAKDLVGQIHSFSRQDSGQFEFIDLYDVAEDALSLLRATLPKTITTEARLGRAANIFGDSTQMHQIVMNLCINARDAMSDEPGKLIIELGEAYPSLDWPQATESGTDTTAPDKRIIFQQSGNRSYMWMGTQPTNAHIRLSVSDTGSGIDPETFQKIFDPFFTTKDVSKGTGLGLAAVQGIIHAHGGSIHIQSTPGEGTRFEIRLPREEDNEAVSEIETQIDENGSGQILLIDNEDQIVTLLKKSLENKGYDVTGMSDSTLALQAVRNEPDNWDVIITDFDMPGLSGIQLSQAVHSIRPGLPVIFCSRSMEVKPEQEFDGPYCDTVLEKPVQEADLFHAIKRCTTDNNAVADDPTQSDQSSLV